MAYLSDVNESDRDIEDFTYMYSSVRMYLCMYIYKYMYVCVYVGVDVCGCECIENIAAVFNEDDGLHVLIPKDTKYRFHEQDL